jgi:hypothetical protein
VKGGNDHDGWRRRVDSAVGRAGCRGLGAHQGLPDCQDRVGLNSRREDSAEETVRQRFARGEIDAEEYEERRRVLSEESLAAPR